MYTALNVARHIVNYCIEKDRPVSNLKLQKMLYFAWVDFYHETGRELFADEICAWKLGPVVPAVYYEFSSFAGMPISFAPAAQIEAQDAGTLNRIIDRYVIYAASALVSMTHAPGAPWDIIFQRGRGNRAVIPFGLIKSKGCPH